VTNAHAAHIARSVRFRAAAESHHNGQVASEGRIEKSVATLLKWSARDNDRAMLFGAELKVQVK